MKKKISELKTDKEAEDFLEKDLSDYIHKGNFHQVKFEFMPKTASVNLRFSDKLLAAVKLRAKKSSMPYQKYIRLVLEKELLNPA